MKNFLEDFDDFIINRLEKSHLKVEKTKEFHNKYDEFNILYEQLIEFLEKTDENKLKVFNSLLNIINELNDLYDNSAYKSGFTDGINMIYSTYPQLKDDTKIE